MTHCGCCHECGDKLRTVLDGEQWCDVCQAYKRYRSHGWVSSKWNDDDMSHCPESTLDEVQRQCDTLEEKTGRVHRLMFDCRGYPRVVDTDDPYLDNPLDKSEREQPPRPVVNP